MLRQLALGSGGENGPSLFYGTDRNGTVLSHYFTEGIWNGLTTTHAPCSGSV